MVGRHGYHLRYRKKKLSPNVPIQYYSNLIKSTQPKRLLRTDNSLARSFKDSFLSFCHLS